MPLDDPVFTPMEPGLTLSIEDSPTTKDERAAMQGYPYKELVGSLVWLAVVSRFDIAFATSYLGHFSANPGPKHWKAACRLPSVALPVWHPRLHTHARRWQHIRWPTRTHRLLRLRWGA